MPNVVPLCGKVELYQDSRERGSLCSSVLSISVSGMSHAPDSLQICLRCWCSYPKIGI